MEQYTNVIQQVNIDKNIYLVKTSIMAIQNKRIELTETEILNHNAKRNSILSSLYSIFRVICIIIQNIYCVSSYLVLSWILLFPICLFNRDLYYRIENHLYNSLLFIVSSWSLAAGIQIVETGDNFKQLIEEVEESRNYNQVSENEQSKYRKTNHKNSSSNISRVLDNDIKDRCIIADGDCNRPLKSVSDNNGIYSIIGNNNLNLDKRQNNSSEHHENIHDPTDNESRDLKNKLNNIQNVDKSAIIENNGITNRSINENTTITKSNNDKLNCQKANNNSNTQGNIINTQSIATKKPRILLLCNHISTADVPLLMQAFSTTKDQSLLWVLDAQVRKNNIIIRYKLS